MAIKYLAGERLIGTAAERTALTYTGSPPQTSWKELDRVTLSGTSDTMDTGTFTAKDNLMLLVHIIRSGSVSVDMTFNADTGSNYAGRMSETGESDGTVTSQTKIRVSIDGEDDEFYVMHFSNIANQEKLGVIEIVARQSGTGAGNAPTRAERVEKWANTSNQITRVTLNNPSGGDFASGSELVVLGCDDDEADSGTNFWEEIEKSPAYTSGTNLSSGTVHTNTFTAKKYLMVSVKTKSVGTNYANYKWRFNSDTGSNYAARYSDSGGSDGTSTSAPNIMTRVGEVASSNALATAFIINKADREKLGILHVVEGGAATGGTSRHEVVFKWANTSNQITSMGGVSSSGSGTNLGELEIRIWGAN